MTDLATRCVKIAGGGKVEHLDKSNQAFSLLSNVENESYVTEAIKLIDSWLLKNIKY